LLWSLQGETADWGGRTTPSAKSAYPLELTVVVENVEGVEAGVYHYSPNTHSLSKTVEGIPERFNEAAVQSAVQNAPVVIFISGDFGRMTKAFDGVEHDENVWLEAGHAAQNLYLQVESLGLGTVVMGGFNPVLMQEVLKIPGSEVLIYQIPVGVPSEL
jgi:SagB-type dehydrogenase family enzyme